MSLADKTWMNKLRREIAVRLGYLTNQSGESLILDNKTIATGEKLFSKIFVSRFHQSMPRPENYPAIFMFPTAGTFEGNPSRATSQNRSFEVCFVIQRTPKNDNLESEMEKIEDTIDYFKSVLVDTLQDCNHDWLNGRVSMRVSAVDNKESIETLEANFKPPFWVGVVTLDCFIASGRM